MKQCTKCNEWKNDDDFYSGRSDCKECKKGYQSKRYAPIKDEIAQRRKSTYRGNLKQCNVCKNWKAISEYSPHPDHWDNLAHSCKTCSNKRNREFYWGTLEHQKERSIKYRKRHREEILKKGREWYRKNRKTKLKKNREWRKENPSASRAIWQRYKARRMNAEGDFTAEQWEKILKYYSPNGKCLCCKTKKDLTIDHVRPLYMGGSNYPSNLQPLCQSCNASKGADKEIDYRPDGGTFAYSLMDEDSD